MLSPMQSASLRAGTIAATRGHTVSPAGAESSRSPQRQKAPRAKRQIEPDHQGNRGNHYHARSKPPLHRFKSRPAQAVPPRFPKKQLNIFNELG
jgi:hypothetical protein